jgi:hypothetical protein
MPWFGYAPYTLRESTRMTIEDWALQFEGLDPVKIKAILDDAVHVLGVIKAELPRIERLIANAQSQILAYEANQKRFQ